MRNRKIILVGSEAREKLKKGIDKVYELVKGTLGPMPKNVLVSRESDRLYPLVVDDGAKIVSEIILDDEIENAGAGIIREVSQKTDAKVGDGTTTAMVMAHALANEAFERIGKGLVLSDHPAKVRKEIEEGKDDVLEKLKGQKREITKEDLYNVALTSSRNPAIAKGVSEAIQKIGKHGRVAIEMGHFEEIEYEITEGMYLTEGYVTRDILPTQVNSWAYDNPYILVTNHVIETGDQIMDLLGKEIGSATLESRALIVIAQNFGSHAIRSATETFKQTKGRVSVVFVKVPYLGKRFHISGMLEDIAVFTGATMVSEDANMRLEDAKLSFLGSAEKVIVAEKQTMILGMHGDTAKLNGRVKELKEQLGKTEGVIAKQVLEERIANLDGGVATIKVGAKSWAERDSVRFQVEDAVFATQSALRHGIVKGGGLALQEIAEELKEGNILKRMLLAPYEQIQKNCNGIAIADSVLDPYEVVKTAFEKACSVVGTLITVDSVIIDEWVDEVEAMLEKLKVGGVRK